MATKQKAVLTADDRQVSGDFIDIDGERYYEIRNVDEMDPFFISLISNSDHWLFASSNGALTAGRVSPDTALLPYVTVDKIHDSVDHTGCKTLIRLGDGDQLRIWEPFAQTRDNRYTTTRCLYKNLLGNKLRYEEINETLQLAFRYTWCTSARYGFVRQCEIENLADTPVSAELLDGLQNILPAGTPRFAQTNTSNLVDAYKWTELDAQTGLAFFTLYSGITDRAEPCESLRANTVFSLGLDSDAIMLSARQLHGFREGHTLTAEHHTRGTRGAYFSSATLSLAPNETLRWLLVADLERDQSDVVALRHKLGDTQALWAAIENDIAAGSDALARIMANGDAFQITGEETVGVHHYANVLFNILRGGIFDNHYDVYAKDFARSLRCFDRGLTQRHQQWLDKLPAQLHFSDLLEKASACGDPQLLRLTQEYLPIRFGRRHGDPSRPWNQFAIELYDDDGERILSYQGNWRDIFQNWEALAFSYPDFVENMIAKFVNASTMDGYNPYRITDQGIDWEVEEPDDPWSYIGYWGDHQIIYLQKLLELSQHFHPAKLAEMLHQPIFCYANVPYRLRSFDAMLKDPKNTVDFDTTLAAAIDARIASQGADGKLVRAADGSVYLTTLLEKLLVPLLAKLGNLVVDGGIWLNTQRPEWNDANNALVGQGLSMVTLYYMRRYMTFLRELLADGDDDTELSIEVCDWLVETAKSISEIRAMRDAGTIDDKQRYDALVSLGQASSHYRDRVYAQEGFSGKTRQPTATIQALLDDALAITDNSIAANRRDDGLYHAYNIVGIDTDTLSVDTLYPMLEGQVAVLSSGAISAPDAVTIVDALFDSDVFRPDQSSFMLYPDRALPDFLAKNVISAGDIDALPLIKTMLAASDTRIVTRDADGNYRFNADLINAGRLDARLADAAADYGEAANDASNALRHLYEKVFDHQSFTGRSGTMFGFEGLGCIYWHMVSKLLLAVQESYFSALSEDPDSAACRQLGEQYYRVRRGIGFNKSPAEYGAFPTDPYSHTPGHAGARQPGMTGQVKEEVLTRFGELGVRVHNGTVTFAPTLLRRREFLPDTHSYRYLAVDNEWRELDVPASSLAFTWCQVPVIYTLSDAAEPSVTLTTGGDKKTTLAGNALGASDSAEIFARSGSVTQIIVTLNPDMLFGD